MTPCVCSEISPEAAQRRAVHPFAPETQPDHRRSSVFLDDKNKIESLSLGIERKVPKLISQSQFRLVTLDHATSAAPSFVI